MKTQLEQLAELDKREQRIRANTNPRYRAFGKMCLAQIARERRALIVQTAFNRHGHAVDVVVPE